MNAPSPHPVADPPGPARAGGDRWRIAASMLQFPGVLPDGRAVVDAGAEQWAKAFAEIAAEGFAEVEILTSWLSPAELGPSALADLRWALEAGPLTAVGICLARSSVIHPDRGAANLDLSHRTIEAAAALGVGHVALGLHDELSPRQRQALWFWTEPGQDPDGDPELRALAVRRVRELAEHAAQVGVTVSVELYDGTYLGDSAAAVRFVLDVGHDAAGLNPDLGNLVRAQRSVERWQEIAAATLPYANYWHVKNYLRAEDPSSRTFLSIPAPLETGLINYRDLLRTAVDLGFRGPLVAEHYGGDGLGISARGREYLLRLLRGMGQET